MMRVEIWPAEPIAEWVDRCLVCSIQCGSEMCFRRFGFTFFWDRRGKVTLEMKTARFYEIQPSSIPRIDVEKLP